MFVIASAPAGGPNIAFDGTNYLVVWYSGTYPALQLYGQLVSTQGALIGSQISIALGAGCHRWADITFDGTKYLVIWQTGENNAGQKIYGQFIGTDGAHIGDTFMICDNTYEQRWWPAITAADSNFIAVWGQGYGSACNIWGNVDVTITGVNEAREYTIHDTGLTMSVTPNPSTKQTQIRLMIHDSGFMMGNLKLGIYDACGRLVKTLNLESCIMDHVSSIRWDGTDQANRPSASGVYFVTLEAGGYSATEKLLLIR
jgi:hypothetical protein